MRKIREEELVKISEAFADMFCDYKAYRLFFDEKTLDKGIRAFFLYEVFCALDFTYTDDDCNVIASVKQPRDRERLSKDFFSDDFLSREFFAVVNKDSFALAEEYVNFAHTLSDKYFNPQTDCYIKNIGVAKKARGKGLLRKTIDSLCGNSNVYLETHNEENVRIYQKLGFSLLEKADFHGIPVYAMLRKTSSD